MRRLCGCIVLILLLLYLANDQFSFYTLNVSRGRGETMAAFPVVPGDQWAIHFTHSWYRVPQNEIYRLDRQGKMVLAEVNFGSYPAAMYYNENPPQGLIHEEGCWKIKRIDQPLSQVRFKVGYTTNCYLMMKGTKLYLTSLASSGESLIFSVVKVSLSQYLYSVVAFKAKGMLA